jgi:hypothetical protein
LIVPLLIPLILIELSIDEFRALLFEEASLDKYLLADCIYYEFLATLFT